MTTKDVTEGAAIDWSQVQLVVFDVDGTLYRQRPVQIRMAIGLLLSCIRRRSLLPIRIIGHYRAHRETLAKQESEDFEAALLADTARAVGVPQATVRAEVDVWLNHRPLPLLRASRYCHLDRVFGALRARGILIGVLSDYPVVDKLRALGLDANLVVWAGQDGVGVLKPHPRGLQLMLKLAGVEPAHALMVGDRDDRDGEIARRCGVRALIGFKARSDGRDTFTSYDKGPFATLLQTGAAA